MTDLPHIGYARPSTLAAALALLQAPGSVAYAGGTDLIVELSERSPRREQVQLLVDIKAVIEARAIARAAGGLRIGALVTADELASNEQARRELPALAQAAAATAAPAIRRRATVGGNLCTPHPAGDVATALLALDATVDIASSAGMRSVTLRQFFNDEDAIRSGEILLRVSCAIAPRSAFEKFGARLSFSRSVVSVAVSLDGEAPRVALGGVAPRPIRALHAERTLFDGTRLRDALALDCNPPDNEAASGAYRLRLAETLTRRCLTAARAGSVQVRYG